MSTEENTAVETPPAAEEISGEQALQDLVGDLMADTQPEEKPEPEEAPEPEDSTESTEAPEEPAEEPEAAAEDAESFAGFKKRIDKLTSQKYELKGELESYTKRIAELERRVADKDNPKDTDINSLIANVQTGSELDRVERDTVDTLRWARKTRNKAKRDAEGAEAEIKQLFGREVDDAEAFLDDLIFNAEEARDYAIPKAKKRIEERSQWDEFANKTYPWLQDSTHKATAVVDQVLSEYGDLKLKDIPNARLTLARAVVGFHHESQPKAKAAPKAKAPKKEPTPQPGLTGSTSAPAKPTANDAADKAAQQVFNGGGIDALSAYVEALTNPQ